MEKDRFPHYSGMDFIPDNAYVIEDSPERLNNVELVRTVEFVRYRNNSLIFIEAKTTFANPVNSPIPYKTEITRVCEKFVHSLSLLSSIKVGVTEEVLPTAFDYSNTVSLTFVLVIKNHKFKWCKPIKHALVRQLPDHIKKIWKPNIFVINFETARNQNLVS
jgi:hypothetical protein